MANEISYSVSLKCTNGNYSDGLSKTSQTQNQTATTGLANAGVASVPTTAGGTAIPLGSVATTGMFAVTNLDANNYIQIGHVVSGTFYPVDRVLAGETHLFRIDSSITPYWLANTSAVQAQFLLLAN